MRFLVLLSRPIVLLIAALLATTGLTVAVPGQALAAGAVVTEACEGGVLPLAIVVPEGGLQAGCQQRYVIKYGAGDGDRGTFGLVDLPPCPESPCASSGGHDRLECELTYGNLCCRGPELIGVDLALLQGDHVGPFLHGILTRWNRDTDHRAGLCYWNYLGNGSRVVRIVVVEPGGKPGARLVRVIGFADFFLRNLPLKPGDDLEGEFISAE